MSTALTSASPARPRSQAERWEAWQDSPVSERLLSAKDRQYGYSVIWVPPPMRGAFLDVAHLLRLYDTHYHKPKRQLSPGQLRQLADWAMATQALIKALQEGIP